MSFPRHFYKAQPLRTLAGFGADISADLLAIEREAEGLMDFLRTPVQSDRPRIATTAHSTQTLLLLAHGAAPGQ